MPASRSATRSRSRRGRPRCLPRVGNGSRRCHFPAPHGRLIKVEAVHDAQVHAANGSLVVVDETHALRRVRSGEDHLLLQLTAHSFLIGVATAIGTAIDRRYMTTDPYALLLVKATFALTGAASVLKDGAAAVSVLVEKDHVGNELLEPRIFFHLAPRPITGVARGKQFRKVALDLRGEPLKVPEALEDLRGHHQYVFGQAFRQGAILFMRGRHRTSIASP